MDEDGNQEDLEHIDHSPPSASVQTQLGVKWLPQDKRKKRKTEKDEREAKKDQAETQEALSEAANALRDRRQARMDREEDAVFGEFVSTPFCQVHEICEICTTFVCSSTICMVKTFSWKSEGS